MRRFRHLDLLTIGFVVVLLIESGGAEDLPDRSLAGERGGAAFPITYICGDVFTEVFGYGASRQAIWIGFFAMALLSAMGAVAVGLPPAPGWPNQQAFASPSCGRI